MIIAHTINTPIFPNQSLNITPPTGPNSSLVLSQAFGYASLSTSLLAAFGAVLGKQSLANFKSSRFGQGTLQERCRRRHTKLIRLEYDHFDPILNALPARLQISLGLFAISLTIQLWLIEKRIGFILITTSGLGVLFYGYAFILGTKSPDSPFSTKFSMWISAQWRKFFEECTRFNWLVYGNSVKLWDIFAKYTRQLHTIVDAAIGKLNWKNSERRISTDLENHGLSSCTISNIDLWELGNTIRLVDPLDLPVTLDNHDGEALLWLLQISTDPEVILSIINAIPHVQWPSHLDYTFILNQMRNNLQAFLDRPEAAAFTDKEIWTWLKGFIQLGLPFSSELIMPRPPGSTLLLKWSGFLDCFLERFCNPHGGMQVDIVIVNDLLGIGARNRRYTQPLPPFDLPWISHILPMIIRQRRRNVWDLLIDRRLASRVILKCFQHHSRQIQANAYLSLILLTDLSPDPKFDCLLNKSDILEELERYVLNNLKYILGTRQLQSNPDLCPLIATLFPRLIGMENRKGIFNMKDRQSYAYRVFVHFIQARNLMLNILDYGGYSLIEYALWGLYLNVTQLQTSNEMDSPLTDMSKFAIALSKIDFNLITLLHSVLCHPKNRELETAALLAISLGQWHSAHFDIIQCIEQVCSKLAESTSPSLRHASILALQTLSSPLEDTLDLQICIDISTALLKLFEKKDYVRVRGIYKLAVTFRPRIMVNNRPRFPTLEYFTILGRLLKCEEWRPHFWDDGHYINCLRVSSMYTGHGQYGKMLKLRHGEEIIKLINLLQMDFDFFPTQTIPEKFNLLPRWHFMSCLDFSLKSSDGYLKAVVFQTHLLWLGTLTMSQLREDLHPLDTSQLQFYIEQLLEFLPVYNENGQDKIISVEDEVAEQGPRAKNHDVKGGEIFDGELIDDSLNALSTVELQKHLLPLTRLLLQKLQNEDDLVDATEIYVHLEGCLQHVPAEEASDIDMLQLRDILLQLQLNIPPFWDLCEVTEREYQDVFIPAILQEKCTNSRIKKSSTAGAETADAEPTSLERTFIRSSPPQSMKLSLSRCSSALPHENRFRYPERLRPYAIMFAVSSSRNLSHFSAPSTTQR
ncbi:hypothetical protein M422DRAFT_247315 [Sphaerobolus stellatus SS14]|nr:hypothetical protein M422DRAFT_247315 [Sphaerobolus stellatus SS14]